MDNRHASAFDSDDTDALSAYWDAVARGVPNPSAAGLDPDTLALIRRIGRAAGTEVPTGGRDQALTAAMNELVGQKVRSNGHERRSNVSSTLLPNPPVLIPLNGRKAPHRGRPTAQSGSRGPRNWLASFVSIAAVAALLLALSGNFGALRTGLSGSDDDRRVSIPAVQVASEATPNAVTPLRTVVIPAEYLPAGAISIDTWVYTQETGSTEEFADLPMKLSLEYALTGSYAVTSNGPRLIWRGGTDAPPEEIAAGSEGVVGPGDTIAYLDDSPQTTRVISDENVFAFGISFFGDSAEIGATEDATVALQRVTLEQGETRPIGETHVERFVEQGVLTFDLYRGDESTPRASQTYEGTVPYAPPPTGVTIIMRNDGDDPLVFLEAIISLPVEAGTPTN